MSKYDPVLGKHYLIEVNDNRRYLSLKIQNEFIHILGNPMKDNILDRIRKANYFAIIHRIFLILIRWVSFVDMSLLKTNKWRCGNYFLVLSLSMKRQLMIPRRWFWIDWRKRNLLFKKCKGTGFDNADSMVWVHGDVQRLLRNINEKTNHSLFMPQQWMQVPLYFSGWLRDSLHFSPLPITGGKFYLRLWRSWWSVW